MRDRLILPLLALAALALIALALVWPQGLGERSPAPFGHPMAAPHKNKPPSPAKPPAAPPV